MEEGLGTWAPCHELKEQPANSEDANSLILKECFHALLDVRMALIYLKLPCILASIELSKETPNPTNPPSKLNMGGDYSARLPVLGFRTPESSIYYAFSGS